MLSSALVRSVLASAPDAMIIIDESGSIIFANDQVSVLFGYSRGEIVGQKVELLMPERFRSRHVMHRHGYADSVRVRPMGIGLDLFALHKDGTEFSVEISLSPVGQDGRTLIAAAIRDVSQRKRVERELKEARETADRANQAKSRFLATASHDLRQPLQTLALLNGTLRRMISRPDAIEALVQQEQAIGAMTRLLNALLDISKLESGAIQPEIVDFPVAPLLGELHGEFAGIASEKGLRLMIDPSAHWVRSDPSLVGQVLRNLISNAIKYTRHGSVQVSCRPAQASVWIDVLDSGIGIAADQLSCIFDEFYQIGVPANASHDGYGLGLSIVDRLIRRLGLRISVASEIGKGSKFSVELPAAAGGIAMPADPKQSPARARQPASPAAHVLLVEDDPAVRDATRLLLKVEGFRVSVAASLKEARQHFIEQTDIELLITDYQLSAGETGIQVIASARERLGAGLKAVLITGDTSSAVQALQEDPGMRIISKPINADELICVLRGMLAAAAVPDSDTLPA